MTPKRTAHPGASVDSHDFDMHAAPREAQQGNFGDRPSQVVRGQRSREAGGGRSGVTRP